MIPYCTSSTLATILIGMLIIFENSLDPDQDRQKFSPDNDLDLNCLTF